MTFYSKGHKKAASRRLFLGISRMRMAIAKYNFMRQADNLRNLYLILVNSLFFREKILKQPNYVLNLLITAYALRMA